MVYHKNRGAQFGSASHWVVRATHGNYHNKVQSREGEHSGQSAELSRVGSSHTVFFSSLGVRHHLWGMQLSNIDFFLTRTNAKLSLYVSPHKGSHGVQARCFFSIGGTFRVSTCFLCSLLWLFWWRTSQTSHAMESSGSASHQEVSQGPGITSSSCMEVIKRFVCKAEHSRRPIGKKRKRKKKRLERLCKKNGKLPLLKKYVYYHIHLEVKENAQKQSIMLG